MKNERNKYIYGKVFILLLDYTKTYPNHLKNPKYQERRKSSSDFVESRVMPPLNHTWEQVSAQIDSRDEH